MNIPVKPSTDPTERSMFRDTMMRTMPVAMIATVALWTERFQRLREVRNSPPDITLKPIQMIASAMIIPKRRVSISRLCSSDEADRFGGSSVAGFQVTGAASVMTTPR